jgi:hypothetical protein
MGKKVYFDVAGEEMDKAKRIISAKIQKVFIDYPLAMDVVARAVANSDSKMVDEISVNDNGNIVIYGWCSGAPTEIEVSPFGEVVDSYNGECDDQGY